MTQDYKKGPFTIYAFDQDGEIEVEFETYDYTNNIYLDRANAIELRDWLNTQLENTA